MVRKYFSIDEAEHLLPSISPLLEEARELKQLLEQKERVTLRRRLMTDGSEELLEEVGCFDAELQELKERFYERVEQVEKRGCILGDIDEGAVNFYTRFEGRDVFLTWRLGEKRIRHWREVEEEKEQQEILELR